MRFELPEYIDGVDVLEVLPTLVFSLGVRAVRLHRLELVPNADQRVVDRPELADLVKSALEVREQYRVPFWEAVLLLARNQDEHVLDLVLRAANVHRVMQEVAPPIDVPLAEFSTLALRRQALTLGANSVLALSSRMETATTGEVVHLPMLDFRIRPNKENEALTFRVLQRLGEPGYLFNSGNSYHFYGRRLLRGAAQLGHFLGQAALFAPYVDQRWIAHQLIEGACALRVSPGKTFDHSPLLIKAIESA